ncbi:MAG: isochorismate synthase, partial [Actinomycetota bacterium]|nr:isochorismate synthase [Actinomycetota bacterium]
MPSSSDSFDQLIATTRPIDGVEDLIEALPPGDNVCWVRRGEGMVGWGVAARLQVRGVERFSRTQRWWAELCDRLTVNDSVSVPGTGPIAFASYSFDPNDASEVVVPAVLIGQRSGQTWMTVIHRAGEESQTPEKVSAPPASTPVGVQWLDGALRSPEWEKIVG